MQFRDIGTARGNQETIEYDPDLNYALVIGIDSYAHWKPLSCAAQDARAIASVLTNTYQFRNVRLLLNEEATREGILEALHVYLPGGEKALGKENSLVIFYAGHGWMEEPTKNGYWVPFDAHQKVSQYVSNSQMHGDYFRRYLVRHLLIIADSCFSGTMMLRGGNSLPGKDRRISSAYRKPSRWVFTSGDLTPVPDDAGTGHSPFATRLLQYLESGDDDVFGVYDLYKYIQQRLNFPEPQIAPLNIEQHMPGGEFVFVRERKTPPRPSTEEPRGAVARPVRGFVVSAGHIISLLQDGSLSCCSLPGTAEAVYNQSGMCLWVKKQLVTPPHKWLGPLHVWRNKVVLVRSDTVVCVDTTFGLYAKIVLNADSTALCQAVVGDDVWLLRSDNLLDIISLEANHVRSFPLTSSIRCSHIVPGTDRVYAYGHEDQGNGLVVLFDQGAAGHRQQEVLSGHVLTCCASTDDPSLVAVVQRDSSLCGLSMWRVEECTHPRHLSSEDVGDSPVESLFPCDWGFIAVTREGAVFKRPYEPQYCFERVYQNEGSLVVPPSLHDGVLALARRLDKEHGMVEVAGIEIGKYGARAECIWRRRLPPISKPAGCADGAFFFVDNEGLVHRIGVR